MSDAEHIYGFIFNDKEDSVLPEEQMANIKPEFSALRSKGAARGEAAETFNGLHHVKVPDRGFFRRIMGNPAYHLPNVLFSLRLGDNLITHRFFLALIPRSFRSSSKNSDAGLPLPSLISMMARIVFMSSITSSIF